LSNPAGSGMSHFHVHAFFLSDICWLWCCIGDLMHWMIWHEETNDGISAVLLLLLHFFCSLAMKLEDVFGMHLPSVAYGSLGATISFGFLEKNYHG
jgi:hypothetical protein